MMSMVTPRCGLLPVAAVLAVLAVMPMCVRGDEPVVSAVDGYWKTLSYYDLLQLDRETMTARDVVKAYRSMAKKHHPDKFPNGIEKTEAEKRFSRLVDAHETLKDPEMRPKYDRMLEDGKVDYSVKDWEEWNYQREKFFEEYAAKYDHQKALIDEVDPQLWMAGIAMLIGVGLCVYFVYGDRIRAFIKRRQQRAARAKAREEANSTTTTEAKPTKRSSKPPRF